MNGVHEFPENNDGGFLGFVLPIEHGRIARNEVEWNVGLWIPKPNDVVRALFVPLGQSMGLIDTGSGFVSGFTFGHVV